jgi:hypothetical protein
MKDNRTSKTAARTTLRLNSETLRRLTVLSHAALAAAHAGVFHTSFSCGRDLCTTHLP